MWELAKNNQPPQYVVIKVTEWSNSFAVSSGDLSNSLTKSSAVLANAGVSFEQQLGLITAGKILCPMHTEMCA